MRRICALFVFVGVFALLAADPAQGLRFGMSLFNDGLYEEALQAFDGVLQEAPASPQAEQALFYSGECWRLRDDQVRAGVNYRRLLEGFPATSLREKALARYGECLVAQQKYAEAAMQLEDLLQRYPQSEQTKAVLGLLAQAWYQTGAYGRLIETVEQWHNTYQGANTLPDAMYWEAEALLARGMEQEGNTLLHVLATDWRAYNASWTAIRRLARLTERDKGAQAAADWLRAQVWAPGVPGRPAADLPRLMAEDVVGQLLRYDTALARWQDADTDAEYLFNTFSNSLRFERYYVAVLRSLTGLGNSRAVLDFAAAHPLSFQNAALAAQRDLLLGAAHLALGRADDALALAADVLADAGADSLRAAALLLTAQSQEGSGRVSKALETYRTLIAQYAAWVDRGALLLHIGRLYADDFDRPDMALPYLRQAVDSTFEPVAAAQAHLALAGAEERLGRYDDARLELDQIPLHNLTDAALRQEISHRRIVLYRFYATNTDAALAAIAQAVAAHAAGGSQADLNAALSRSLAWQAHRYDEALALADKSDVLHRGLLLLDMAEKARHEGNTAAAENYLAQLGTLRADLPDGQPAAQELDLNRTLRLDRDYKATAALVTGIESFVQANPNAQTANLLRLAAADGRLAARDSLLAMPLLRNLSSDDFVPPSEFRRAKLALADILFRRADYAAARLAYEQAAVDLFSGGAAALYRYSVCLQQTGATDKALQTLCAALDSGEPFPGYAAAVTTATDAWIKARQPDKALRYLQLMPEPNRNADYWIRLADIQLALNRPQDALKALQGVANRDVPTALKLADLQIRTGDYAAAARSFADLASRDPGNKTQYQVRQAQALYAQEQYTEALAVFDKVAPTLTADASRYTGFNLREVAEQAVVAGYRAGNRPKAEQYAKQFQSLLSDAATKARLDLNEGIYYVRMDPGKATRLLGKLADDTAVNASVRREAQFWRGVACINDNMPDKATTDFLALARQTDDPRMQTQAHLKLGTLCFSAEQFDDALAHYSWVIEHDARGDLALDALENYATVCKAIDAWDRAVAAYELLLQRKPDTAMQAKTRFDVAYCYYRAGKYDRAYALFTEVLPELATPELKAEAQFWMGACRFDQEDYEQAVNEYLKVSYSYPDLAQWSATAELKAADAYVRMGKTDRARSLLERIIAKYGRTSDWGREAGKVLERL